MKYLSIKSFETLQHYKDWQPPWIKLYNRLLDDYAFLQLSEIAQRHLICLWLLASRHDNRIPNDLVYITRAIQAKSAVDLDELIIAGFVVPTDTAPRRKRRKHRKITPAKVSRPSIESVKKKSDLETETETEKKKNRHRKARTGLVNPLYRPAYEYWVQKRGYVAKRAFEAVMAPFFPEGIPRFTDDQLRGAIEVFSDAASGATDLQKWQIWQFGNSLPRLVELGEMDAQLPDGTFTERGEYILRAAA